MLIDNLLKSVASFRRERNLRILDREIRGTILRPIDTIMTKKVVGISDTGSVHDAARMMVEEGLSCLVVFRQGKVVGLITETDFVEKVDFSQSSMDQKVSEVMAEHIYSGSPDATIFEASRVMVLNKFRKLPVMSQDRLVGIVTQTDIVKALNRFGTRSIMDTMNTLRVWNAMSRELITVSQAEKCQSAKSLMARKGISCILATDSGQITGIVTQKDFVNEMAKDIGRLKNYRVQDIMKSPVVSIPPYFHIFEANSFMIEKNFRRLLVSKDAENLGLITQTDICREAYLFLDELLKKIANKTVSELFIEKVSED